VFVGHAQKSLSPDYSYNISEPYQVYDAAKKFYFSDGKEILTVKPWKKYIAIQKFDVESLKQLSIKEYKEFPKNYVVEGMIESEGRYYFFYSSWSGKKTKQERLYAWEIDFSKGEFIGEPIKIVNVKGKVTGHLARSNSASMFSFGGVGVVDKFDIYTSLDQSKILIKYRKKPKVKNDKKSKDILGVQVFDSNLTNLWKNEYRMPYTERRMDALDFAVDSQGDGYILSKVYHDDSNRDKKKRKDKNANFHIELFKLRDGVKEIETTKITLEEKFIATISLFETNDGTMTCAGFYNRNGSGGSGNVAAFALTSSNIMSANADGVFVSKITKEGELINKSSFEIPVEVLNQYVKNRTKKKNKKKDKKGKAEFESLVLKDLFFMDDGSFTLVAEQDYIRSHRNSKGHITYTYHYNDMLITKVSPDGELEWMKKLPKRQSGAPKMGQVYDTSKRYQGGMSYSYFYTRGNHYLVFLDNVKNIDLPLDKIPARHTDGHGGYITSYKIDNATGTVSKANIFDTRNAAKKIGLHQFSNNRVVKTAEDEFVIEFYKKKKEDVLVKVKIN
jgi:hypothetical protein